MKITSRVFMLATVGLPSVLAQACNGAKSFEQGNWYCEAVEQILYQGLYGSSSYKDVTGMSGGTCQTREQSYKGPLAPLDEDLSMSVRGPVEFKEFAVYNVGSKKKRDDISSRARHLSRHAHMHEKRQQVVQAQMPDGTPFSFTWPGNPQPTQSPDDGTAVQAKEKGSSDTTSPKSTSTSSSGNGKHHSSSHSGPWERVAYYNAEKATTDNVIFMGNYGGQGSGVWDSKWGNSLAFLNAKATGGSSSPQTLGDIVVPSGKEFSIFSAEKCDESCGFARAKDVAYKGFAGANKVFLFRFRMPHDGSGGGSGGSPEDQDDMPALWMLNGRIPRTAQYDDCSCWASGCGELDIYEVLNPGGDKCKSTFHFATGKGGGSSDYFKRPTDDFATVAVVFDEETASVSIKRVDDKIEFGDSLTDSQVKGWMGGDDVESSSLFSMGS